MTLWMNEHQTANANGNEFSGFHRLWLCQSVSVYVKNIRLVKNSAMRVYACLGVLFIYYFFLCVWMCVCVELCATVKL